VGGREGVTGLSPVCTSLQGDDWQSVSGRQTYTGHRLPWRLNTTTPCLPLPVTVLRCRMASYLAARYRLWLRFSRHWTAAHVLPRVVRPSDCLSGYGYAPGGDAGAYVSHTRLPQGMAGEDWRAPAGLRARVAAHILTSLCGRAYRGTRAAPARLLSYPTGRAGTMLWTYRNRRGGRIGRA